MPRKIKPPEDTRTCKDCGVNKPIDDFPFSSASLWRRHSCKPCYSASQLPKVMAAYRANREEISAKRRAWRAEQKLLGIAPKKRNRQENAAYVKAHRASDVRRLDLLRRETFAAYGGVFCSCCGERELMFLSLDHIDGGGNQHRNETGVRGGHKFYNMLKKQGYPAGYQVLCMNCNCGKHRNGGTCPHQKRE